MHRTNERVAFFVYESCHLASASEAHPGHRQRRNTGRMRKHNRTKQRIRCAPLVNEVQEAFRGCFDVDLSFPQLPRRSPLLFILNLLLLDIAAIGLGRCRGRCGSSARWAGWKDFCEER
eukprot:scaffold113130_cov31-Tisochrysis_lutea.AAC.2